MFDNELLCLSMFSCFHKICKEIARPVNVRLKAKIYGVLYNPVSSIDFLMKHLVIGQRQKAPNFSAFHWSPHGRVVSIGQHFITRG